MSVILSSLLNLKTSTLTFTKEIDLKILWYTIFKDLGTIYSFNKCRCYQNKTKSH